MASRLRVMEENRKMADDQIINKKEGSVMEIKLNKDGQRGRERGKKCDPYAGDMIGLAGISGEAEAFYAAFGALKRLYLKVFNNKIIPFGETGSRGVECDLICVGRRCVYVFEVKHLSGELNVSPDGSWLLKQRRGHGEKKLGNGFGQAERCRRALTAFLSLETGAAESEIAAAIESRVLFTCDNFDDSALSEYKDRYINLRSLESYLYFNELTGPSPAFIERAALAISGIDGMCVIGVNGPGGAPVSILRGEIAAPVFCRKIHIKKGAIDYYNTFCASETILTTQGISHIELKGKTKTGEFLASVNYSSGAPALAVLITSPVLEFKPRGFESVSIDFGNISSIAFC